MAGINCDTQGVADMADGKLLSVRALWCLVVVLTAAMLFACGHNPAPVSSRQPPPDERINYHLVVSGDTLFAIAWRYEKDMLSLARANNLVPPYKILVGQRLTLNTLNAPPVRRSVAKPAPVPGQRADTTTPGSSKKAHDTDRAAIATGSTNKPKATPKRKHLPAGKLKWRWPVKGAVTRQYDAGRVFKGLNIQSVSGRSVSAAAPGTVVYAGSGLRGYGKLIIIKHNDIYLSAYAHNRILSVREGDTLKGGAEIAKIGGDPNNSGRLYFEIRKNGIPVDPLRLMPRQ
ncbi:MAG: peptidase M23 [Gammaproteobacteria bacterium]|nr:MAG: peptidase M23 [Gammaproteobacteria bacterium]RLA54635.1 MAG: peptidase M23 [Gammaproteobacteria bacterium]